MIFEILDHTTSKAVDTEAQKIVKSILQYPDIFWKNGPYRKTPKNTTKFLVDRNYRFLTGFMPKIKEILKDKRITITITDYRQQDEFTTILPCLPDITLRADQERLIQDALNKRRGVLKAPTRTGKTVIAGALISCLPETSILFLVHTLDLLSQTAEEFRKFGFSIGIVGNSSRETGYPITIATRQSLANMLYELSIDEYDIIIVDETHHVSTIEGQYGKILAHFNAPFKLGFTATLPEKKKEKMILEGLIGPVIGEITQEEAKELGVLAETKVRICKVPEDPVASNFTTYHDAYRELIVRKRSRNKFIMDLARKELDEGKTVLIIVRRVAHGFYIKEMFEKFLPDVEVPFLCGNIDSETQVEIKRLKGQRLNENMKEYLDALIELKNKIQENSKNRNLFRKKLNERKIKCIIATRIWNEGINIPTLNTIILAGAGKSETETIQSGSRAFTKAENKEHGLLIDLFDPNYKSFVTHFGHRISMYCDLGWI